MNNQEIWESITGWVGYYEVSNKSRVRSIDRHTEYNGVLFFRKGVILKQSKTSAGYPSVGLSIDGIKTTKLVHRLVAELFIPNPENKRTVNHKNGERDDNRIDNLEWSTYSENHQHAYDILGRKANRGEMSGTSVLTEVRVKQIVKMINSGKSQRFVAKEHGVTRGAIQNILRGVTWSWLTGINPSNTRHHCR